MALLALLAPLLLAGNSRAESPEVSEFRLPNTPSNASAIAAGPDGSMWFGATTGEPGLPSYQQHFSSEIDRILPTGEILTVASATPTALRMTLGPDGNMWFLGSSTIVDRITPSGQVTAFPIPLGASPQAITLGSEGNLWFTEYYGHIGRIAPDGQITEFSLPTEGSHPAGIAAGSDGNLWFTEQAEGVRPSPRIGRITPDGQISEFSLPNEGSRLGGITVGSDGNLWFTEQRADSLAIGRISPSGQLTEFPFPTKQGFAAAIVQGADGRLWFDYGLGMIGTITPSGRVTRIELPNKTEVRDIALGPEGNIWYTAASEPPCEGGGLSCSMQVPKEPGIVGRITMGPLAIAIIGSRVSVRHRWMPITLACQGGDASDICRGVLRLSIPLSRNRRQRPHGSPQGTIVLARRPYTLGADEERGIAIRLRRRALRLLIRRRRLPVTATATARKGQSASRSVILRLRARSLHQRQRRSGAG